MVGIARARQEDSGIGAATGGAAASGSTGSADGVECGDFLGLEVLGAGFLA